MRISTCLLLTGLLAVSSAATTTAGAADQLYEASWSVKAFGNERSGGTGDEEVYSASVIPLGIQCNDHQPRCPFQSTVTDGVGNWAPLGGSQNMGLYCAPWDNWGGAGTSVRPAKGATLTNGAKSKRPIPPLYRNPNFFSSAGQPNLTFCSGISTGYTTGGKGRVQVGSPITGMGNNVITSGKAGGPFTIPAATALNGIQGTREGEFPAFYPYVYSYTYATLRNIPGFFGPGSGPGSFNIVEQKGANTVASINVKQGAAKFGGTMRMLGSVTGKSCYYRNGGCSQLSQFAWNYEEIGTSVPTGLPYTSGGVILQGYQVLSSQFWFNSGLGQTSTVMFEGSRFPWTTGSISITAVGRGPHETRHYEAGYDNRGTTAGGSSLQTGVIQLVSPTMTRWLQPALQYETAGIAILKIKFVPEPHTWVMLAAGISLLGVGYRMRGR
jgi:hypothetical protein